MIPENRGYNSSLGPYQSAVVNALVEIRDEQIIRRIWDHDHTVWKPDPDEITNRLGWLHIPEKMIEMLPDIISLAQELRDEGYTHALLMGMGGSSLAPEVFRFTFGVRKGFLDLSVLDSTDPGAISEFSERLNPAKTIFIVSTKSGGTVETISFFKYFYNWTLEAMDGQKAGEHFIAITDPGSGLEMLARELNFRKIFLNDPDIGGRYSALSCFGLVPAVLMGVDVNTLLDRAVTMIGNNKPCDPPFEKGNNPGAWLGAVLGELAAKGRDKLTLLLSPAISYFGSWIEQLVAESSGKEGKGILPVHGEALLSPDSYAGDRLFVYVRIKGDGTYDQDVQYLMKAGHPVVRIDLQDLYDLGGEFFRWEMATAVTGYRLGINPFDQPDVEAAKVGAREMLVSYQENGKLPEPVPTLKNDDISVFSDLEIDSPEHALKSFLNQARLGDGENTRRSYVALQAYLKPSSELDEVLDLMRRKIRINLKVATTVGYGPRFLHSTGQLHKGDGGHGLFIQLTGEISQDVDIPQEAGETASISFGTLKMAQALGDCRALLDAHRKVIRFHFGKDVKAGLKRLVEAL
ncbi:MAG: glucose-6-phosphate isomerase [Desulfobacterales bacterium]|nr:glucose-6-phosphate isomerase [Desulfobacterales bacterium]